MFGTFDFKLCAGENLLSVFATDNNPMNTALKIENTSAVSVLVITHPYKMKSCSTFGDASSVQDTSLLQPVIETVAEKVKSQ